MFKKVSVSVYPEGDWAERTEKYLKAAAALGCGGVFSSVHIPEKTFEEQIGGMKQLAEMTVGNGMELTVDISGHELKTILSDPSLASVIKYSPIRYLRLDYAATQDLLRGAYNVLGARGFVLNASTLSRREIAGWMEFFRGLENVSVKACHNFYPRSETGMKLSFMLEKSRLYAECGIEVACCVASLSEPRGPLRQGLPSVEHQRYFPPLRAAAELALYDEVDEILFGDPFVPESDIAAVVGIRDGVPLPLPVVACVGVSPEEEALVFGGTHVVRPDSAAFAIRSQSTREMSQFGRNISPRKAQERGVGAVTVDNVFYGRYTGELQVVLEALPADERVNVAARVREDELWRLSCLRPGAAFRFVRTQ